MKLRNLTLIAATVAALGMATPSFAQGQGQGQGRRGGFGTRGGGPTSLLFMPEVQKELKMEQAQIELLSGLRQQRGQGGADRQSFRDLSPEERTKRMEAARAEQDKKIKEILDAKQVARLKQLEVQQSGVRALTQPSVAEALKITPAQKTQIEAATTAERTAMREAFAGFRGNGGNGGQRQRPTPEQMQEMRTKMEASRTATETKILGVLTADQKKQFEALKGAPFTFPQRGQRGGNRQRQIQ